MPQIRAICAPPPKVRAWQRRAPHCAFTRARPIAGRLSWNPDARIPIFHDSGLFKARLLRHYFQLAWVDPAPAPPKTLRFQKPLRIAAIRFAANLNRRAPPARPRATAPSHTSETPRTIAQVTRIASNWRQLRALTPHATVCPQTAPQHMLASARTSLSWSIRNPCVCRDAHSPVLPRIHGLDDHFAPQHITSGATRRAPQTSARWSRCCSARTAEDSA